MMSCEFSLRSSQWVTTLSKNVVVKCLNTNSCNFRPGFCAFSDPICCWLLSRIGIKFMWHHVNIWAVQGVFWTTVFGSSFNIFRFLVSVSSRFVWCVLQWAIHHVWKNASVRNILSWIDPINFLGIKIQKPQRFLNQGIPWVLTSPPIIHRQEIAQCIAPQALEIAQGILVSTLGIVV